MSRNYLIISLFLLICIISKCDMKNVRLDHDNIVKRDAKSAEGPKSNKTNEAPTVKNTTEPSPKGDSQKSPPLPENVPDAKPNVTDVDENQGTSLAITSDAFVRGFYVLVGASVIFMIYLGIKTMRINKPPSPDTQVHKYGVVARRGDLEMLPLPLNEEEDDDTVFDLGNHLRNTSNNQ